MERNKRINLYLLIVILIFAVFLRLPTFKLPHDNGDQLFYLATAMKLDKFGFSGYTLRGVELKCDEQLLGLFPTQTQKGNLLKNLETTGVSYYNEPLFHSPYGFPYALMLSHKILAKNQPYLALKTSGWDEQGRVYSKDADNIWFIQFYAAFIPFIFSLLFILGTYLLARKLFSEKIALISTFLVTISPIEILCSQKIWADTMTSFFVVLTVLLFFLAKEKDNLLLCLAAGISCGIAILTKLTGTFIMIAILIFHFWQRKSDILKLNKIYKIAFDKYLLVFILGALIVSFHWFYIVTQTYGRPIYSPPYPTQGYEGGLFFMTLRQRPNFLYLVAIPYLLPLFSLAYFSVIVGPFIRGFVDKNKAFLIIWILTFLGILMYKGATKENRYMLSAYPAIAMLSADLLVRIENFINNRLKKHYGLVFVILALIVCAFWSVPIGIKHALANCALILKPF